MTKKKPNLKVEYVPIGKLKPFKGNPRKNEAAVGEIVRSIEHYGYTSPILARRANNEVIAGHTRLLALKETGAEKVPVIYLDMSVKEARAYGIFDNKSTENTEWDVPKLTDLIEQLTSEGVEWEDLGFTEEELAEMQPVMDAEPDPKDDIVPDAPKEPKTKLGDLYLLGEHRLLCGDSTKAEDVERVMGGEKADMVFTDPPYGIDVVQGNQVGGDSPTKFGKVGGENIVPSNVYKKIEGDKTTDTARDFYLTCVQLGYENICLWGGNYFSDFLPPSRCWIIWDKEMTGNFSQCEMAWTSFNVGGIRLFKFLWNGLSREGNRKDELTGRVHPTQKPVGLFTDIFMKLGDFPIIYDGFLGSGTTIIAAEKLGRKCFGLEIDETYCDVIVQRWEDFTSQKAERVRAKRAG